MSAARKPRGKGIKIIAGSHRGRRLHSPPGLSVRPTGSLARGALFDILGALVPGADVLDLYAGTGALGIEALSRGARSAVLVENDRAAAESIAESIKSLGLGASCRLVREDAIQFLSRCRDPFGIIMADPPYLQDQSARMLEAVAFRGLLRPGGVLAYQHDPRHKLSAPPPALEVWKSRRHGRTQLTLYRNQQEQ